MLVNIYSVPHTHQTGQSRRQNSFPGHMASGTVILYHLYMSGQLSDQNWVENQRNQEEPNHLIYTSWVSESQISYICGLEYTTVLLYIYLLLCFTLQLPLVSLSHCIYILVLSLTVHQKSVQLLLVSIGVVFKFFHFVPDTTASWKGSSDWRAFKDRIWILLLWVATNYSHSLKLFG